MNQKQKPSWLATLAPGILVAATGVGKGFRSRWWINAVLIVTVLLFVYMGVLQLTGGMPSAGG